MTVPELVSRVMATVKCHTKSKLKNSLPRGSHDIDSFISSVLIDVNISVADFFLL